MEPEVKVLFFGAAQEAVGKTEEMFNAGDTESLKGLLAARYPAISHIPFRMALNRSLLKEKTVLKKNDVIAILPPFQGG